MVFEFFAKESVAWEETRQQAQEEANRKRSEAMEGRAYASKGEKRESRPSNDVPPSQQPKPPKSRADYTSTKKAKAAGVSEKTAERAHAVVENRPDLALKVKDGEITLNEAVREMKRAEIKSHLDELAAHEVDSPTGEYDVVVIDPPWLSFYPCFSTPVIDVTGRKR